MESITAQGRDTATVVKGEHGIRGVPAQQETMLAIVQDKYGSPDVLELREIDKPVVNDNEVLVRVHAASANPADWHALRGLPLVFRMVFGLRRPKIKVLGRDVAGRVEAVGKKVTRFRPGDDVYAEFDRGSFSQYSSVSEDLLCLKPVNLTYEQAAAVPLAAVTALQGLRDTGKVKAGDKVLINGASGGVGTFAVQIARSFGAEVTGVASTRNVAMVRSIGADQVIDYTQEDFTDNGQLYNVIFDLVGKQSLSDCRRALAPNGTLVLCSGEGGRWLGPIGRLIGALVLSLFVSHRLRPLATKPSKEDLAVLKELIESGKVTPVIDRTYPLSEAAEAIRFVEEGHAQGKVVVTVRDASSPEAGVA